MSQPEVPVLSYIGSVDTSTSSNGVNMFQIYFNSSITSVLMFEYMILDDNASNPPTTEQMITGFINPDSAQTQGIANQWIIPIPSTGNNYITGKNVRVRVYPADGLNVTEWSNSLELYNPPNPPVINLAKYDADTPIYYYNDDDLWVLLDDTGDDIDVLRYLLAYYYCDTSNNTVWAVSDLLTADRITYTTIDGVQTKLRLHCSIGNDVSILPNKQVVYVAAHTVYPFEYENNTYYTISEISNTVTALPASYEPPVLEPVDYDYTNQSVTLDWTAPTSSFIPFYNVSTYTIYRKINDSEYQLLATVDGDILTYTYTNTETVCGTELSFYVVATSATGAEEQTSNTENIYVFYAASAPQGLNYTWAVFTEPLSNDNAEVLFSFENPSDLGCGSNPQIAWQIVNTSTSQIMNSGVVEYIPNPESPEPPTVYSVIADFSYNILNFYVIQVFAQTTNTNPPFNLIDGAVATSSSIIPSRIPFIYNIALYSDVYTSGVTFNVSSRVEVNPTAQLAYIQVDGNTVSIASVAFDMMQFNPPNYTGVYTYNCNLQWSNLEIDTPPDGFAIMVANQAGVGIGKYNNN